MASAYNISLLLVRTLALLFISIGLMGFVFIAFTVIFFATGVAPWLVEPALSYAAQSFFGSPVYLIGGLIVMRRSVPIARFVSKYCDVA